MNKIIMVRALSPVEGDALEPQVPKDKVSRLVDALNKELQRLTWQAWIYCPPSDEPCWRTASALQRGLEKALPEIVEQDFLLPRRFEETDKWTRRMIGHSNSFILVTQPQFTDTYPTHFWQRILNGPYTIAPLKEGEAVSFAPSCSGDKNYCTLLS